MAKSDATPGRKSSILRAHEAALSEASYGVPLRVLRGMGRLQTPLEVQAEAEGKHSMASCMAMDAHHALKDITYRALGSALDTAPAYKQWWMGPVQDQGKLTCPEYVRGNPAHRHCGEQPFCVGATWYGMMLAGPIKNTRGVPSILDTYHRAQELDPWPGTDYAGTSTMAGASVMRELGFIEEFVWASTPEEALLWLLTKGPLAIGIDWQQDMFTPQGRDAIVTPTGGSAGGHDLIVSSANRRTGYATLFNSWGLTWGRHGRARIKLDDLWRVIFDNGGDCAGVIEARKQAGDRTPFPEVQ